MGAEWPDGVWLGFDFGLKRIGVAVGQTTTDSAAPLEVVRHGKDAPDWQHLDQIIRAWRPVGFMVGLPLDSSGGQTAMSEQTRAFGASLAERYECPVAWSNERLSTRAASARFAERRAQGAARRKNALTLDAMAAAIVLEDWLQSGRHGL